MDKGVEGADCYYYLRRRHSSAVSSCFVNSRSSVQIRVSAPAMASQPAASAQTEGRQMPTVFREPLHIWPPSPPQFRVGGCPRSGRHGAAGGRLCRRSAHPPADQGTVSKPPVTDESTTNDPAVDARIEAMIATLALYLGVAYRVKPKAPTPSTAPAFRASRPLPSSTRSAACACVPRAICAGSRPTSC